MTYRKKLIEVALPLEAINRESAREKSIRHGHPSTLHLWWARRPLAACRAVLFSSLVDDPDSDPVYAHLKGELREQSVGEKRGQLFNLIEELVKWENSNDETVINAARAEIARCVASRKIELGELKAADILPGGATVGDLVTKGHGRLDDIRAGRWRLPPAEAVNAFLAEHAPPVLDPFCGGGSIPLEAQRLGLRAFASDLNPVPVLITKALIEIPPRFAGCPPVNPDSRGEAGPAGKQGKGKGQALLGGGWKGAAGLAEDVRYYGQWMRDEAEKRIGRLYPKVKITAAMAADRPDLKPYIGQELTVIAWLWARTVPSPNPALGGAHVPLVRSFWLSTKKGKEAWVEPIIERGGKDFHFAVGTGTPPKTLDPGVGTVKRQGGTCLLSKSPMPFTHIRAEAKAGRMRAKLMAIVAEGERGRVYLSPTDEHEQTATSARPTWGPHEPISHWPGRTNVVEYGLDHFDHLFTPRQLVALTTFSDLVMEVRGKVLADAREAGFGSREAAGAERQRDGAERERSGAARAGDAALRRVDETPRRMNAAARRVDGAERRMDETPRSVDAAQRRMDAAERQSAEIAPSDAADAAASYADAVATYLAFNLNKLADIANALCAWEPIAQCPRHLFGRQAIPMVWDFAEGNPLGDSSGSWSVLMTNLMRSFDSPLFQHPRTSPSFSKQADATSTTAWSAPLVYSTDPPYYDNIGYADLSDFFYVWIRRSLGGVYPELFRTLLTPKTEELIASPYRHDGSKEIAMSFFEKGLGGAFSRMRDAQHRDVPITVFYAFKQSESDETEDEDESDAGAASTGWETMLEGLITAGLTVNGTWPMRTEMGSRMVGQGTNALASSIVLVCHPRAADAAMTTRKDFVAALKKELPAALRDLQSGNIAPVDLAQAAIGPGMAIYSRYSKVVNSDGTRMPVRTALQLINQALDEVLSELESEFDSETRWAIKWFEQHAHDEGAYGTAETLSTAMAVSVNGLKEAGLIKSGQGKVRLLKRDELAADWDPATDKRLTIWEVTQYLIRRLESGGDEAAAELLRKVGTLGEVARDLAYRLYSTCERKKWAEEARSYNGLVVAWPEIVRMSRETPTRPAKAQAEMFE